jgi:endonuclease YncB( thermonuclease family)
VGDKDVGAEMVAAGWAMAFRRYSDDYVNQEALARRAVLGIWRGNFERPEDVRHRR